MRRVLGIIFVFLLAGQLNAIKFEFKRVFNERVIYPVRQMFFRGDIPADGICCLPRESAAPVSEALVLQSGFRFEKVEPKIFCPNAGDEVEFYFKNPNFLEINIKVFAIDGSLVRRNLPQGSIERIVWNGKDKDGRIVKSGIYIYQIEVEGMIIDGTIVVVR